MAAAALTSQSFSLPKLHCRPPKRSTAVFSSFARKPAPNTSPYSNSAPKPSRLFFDLDIEIPERSKSLVPLINSQPASLFSLRRRKEPNTVFVAGATGQSGVRIVLALLRQGFSVRAGVPDLTSAQDLARLAAAYRTISPEESRRLNAVEVSLADSESIAKAIGPAAKAVITVGPGENGPEDNVTHEDALRSVRAAGIAGVGHLALVYDARAGRQSTYNVLDGITAFFSNFFPGAARPLTLSDLLSKLVETGGMAYTVMKATLTDDYSPESSHALVLDNEYSSPGNTPTFSNSKVSKSQIAKLVAEVFSNTSLAENKVVEVSTSASASPKPVPELLRYESYIPHGSLPYFEKVNWTARLSPTNYMGRFQIVKRSLGFHSGDQIASLVNHDADAINYVVQEKEFSSSCDSSYQLTPGTLEFAIFHTLFLVGSKGLTSEEVVDYIKEHSLCNLTEMESAHTSITNILSSDSRLFKRTSLLTYRLKSCFQKDPYIAQKIYTGATEIINLSRNMLSGIKVSKGNFEDLVLTDEIDDDLRNGADDHHLGGKFTGENWFNLNNTRASTSLSNHHQNRCFEAGLVNKSGFENGYRVSSVSFESEEDEIVLSTLNDEFFDSNPELDRPSGDVIMSNELISESWVQELTEEEYSSLSIEERLKVLVALIGVIVDGNLFHIFIEERLKEAQTCKKMMWTKMRLNTKLQERLNAIPTSFSKQNLSQQLSYSSNSLLHEQFDCTPALSLSQLEVYIDQEVERIHSYRFLPLGKDRRHNRYWQFTTSSSHNDPGSGRIFFESNDGFWRVIDSDEAFDAILSALDTRGIRESRLYFMLKLIETTFKDTSRRSKNREHFTESTTERQATIAHDCSTSHYSAISISVPTAYETPQCSTSFNIDFLENENERSSSKKYLQFMKWMWQECFNSDLLCAMRYGTKRCQQLLEVCHICYQSYLAEEKHCPSCHVTFIACNNAYENFSAHVAHCEANFKIQLAIPFCPINFQLLKAQLAIIEVSIPIEAFHPFWNDEYRKSWGIKLNLSSSAREIFQNLTLLEGAIKPDCLCPDFITTNEFLSSGKYILLDNSSTVSEPVPVLPWIPDTSAAVALRLLDLDASIPYMLQHGLEPLEGTEDEEFLVLPRSKLVNPIHQTEPAASGDADDQNGGQRKPDKDGGGKENCTGFGQRNSESKDFSGSSYTGEAGINNESSGSLRADKSPAFSSYETNAGSVNMCSISEAWYSEDESEQRDVFGVCEAVESNECRRWQGAADSFLGSEVYLDEQQSEGGHDDEFVREKGLVGEVISSSSVNTV